MPIKRTGKKGETDPFGGAKEKVQRTYTFKRSALILTVEDAGQARHHQNVLFSYQLTVALGIVTALQK